MGNQEATPYENKIIEEFTKLTELLYLIKKFPHLSSLTLRIIRERQVVAEKMMTYKYSWFNTQHKKPDIVQVISKHTSLRQIAPHKHRGCCPIHNGKNPTSLSVDDELELFYCFACGEGGDVYNFLSAINQEDIGTTLRRYNA